MTLTSGFAMMSGPPSKASLIGDPHEVLLYSIRGNLLGRIATCANGADGAVHSA